MKTLNRRSFLTPFLALSFSLLAACSSAPQATDPVEDLAALADADGSLEATLEIQSVGSSSGLSVSSDVRSQLVYQKIDFVYKGKPIQGILAALEGAIHAGAGTGTTVQGAGDAGVSAALAQGDRVKVRGRVSKIKGVPTFVGVMRPDSPQASAAAVAAPVPVVLVSGNKTLAHPAISSSSDLASGQVTGNCSTLRDMEILIFRPTDGKPFSSAMFKSTKGIKFDGVDVESGVCRVTLNLQASVVLTPIGPVVQLMGQIRVGSLPFQEVSGIGMEVQ